MNHPQTYDRRRWLLRAAQGSGVLAWSPFMAATSNAYGGPNLTPGGPYVVRAPHYPARAKRCIFLYMPGGPSQVDLFDPKPRVIRDHGQPLPFEKPKLERTRTGNLFGSPWRFERHGQCGTEISELLPYTAAHLDKMCVIRSMVADNINHTGAALQMMTGEQAFSRPCMGAWLLYGLGTENQNLPGFVVLCPAAVFQGAQLWAASFLPSAFQGTLVRDMDNPIANLSDPLKDVARQQRKLTALRQLNQRHKLVRNNQSTLDARDAAFDLAYRMQQEAPEAFDLTQESSATHALYGTSDATTQLFGRQCLLARRLVERGVRFVQVFDAPVNNAWDHHGDIRNRLPKSCRAVDQPIAALLHDLESRGLLEDTLVLWGGEFGRSPTAQGSDGREHHPFGFTMWMAGGGIRGGMVHGATDEYGWHAVQDRVHVHDLHATILHLMGFDHTRLTVRHAGRDYRLTDVHGNVVQPILA